MFSQIKSDPIRLRNFSNPIQFEINIFVPKSERIGSDSDRICTLLVCTEKYRTEVFFVQTEPVARGLYKKTEVRYFSVQTEQARLIKSLFYRIFYFFLAVLKRWSFALWIFVSRIKYGLVPRNCIFLSVLLRIRFRTWFCFSSFAVSL